MNTPNSTQFPGLELWMRAFRESMSGFQPPGFPPAAAFPDMSAMSGAAPWPGASPWPGAAPWSGTAPWAAVGQMPGMMQGAMGGAAPGVGGAFSGMFDQMAALAQSQWQQLASRFIAPAAQTGGGIEQWRQLMETLAPVMLAAGTVPAPGVEMDKAWREALSTPQVGPMREHVERWQQTMLAQLDYQDAGRAFSNVLSRVMQHAQRLFEQRLAARAQAPADQPATAMRALFNEWIEAGEQAWAEHAGSDDFVAALGQYTNAQLRVRAAMAADINRWAESLGLPTRAEVEADHRRIAELQRELRRLRTEVEALHGADRSQRDPAPAVSAKPAPAEASPAAVPSPRTAAPMARAATAAAPRAQVKKSRRAAASAAPVRKTTSGKPLKAATSAKTGNAEKTGKTPSPKAEKRSAKPAVKAGIQDRAARVQVTPTTLTNVLPIVSIPRAIGVATPTRTTDLPPRRRASK